MSYKSYVTEDYYQNQHDGDIIPEEKIEKALKQASRHIDSLTYNRIVSQGFSSLTEFQQEIIREVVCMQADFEYENADEINCLHTASMECLLNSVAVGMSSWIKV